MIIKFHQSQKGLDLVAHTWEGLSSEVRSGSPSTAPGGTPGAVGPCAVHAVAKISRIAGCFVGVVQRYLHELPGRGNHRHDPVLEYFCHPICCYSPSPPLALGNH